MLTRGRPTAPALFAAFLAGAAAPAVGCGFCVDDRVAAVYDQALIDNALAHQRQVVFFALEGTVSSDQATRRAVLLALNASGAVPGSARLSLENGACSVAYDPARTNLAKLAAAAGKVLASRGLVLIPLRIIDARGRLREP